jgi:FtsP/CotA-like multicopper oxidase with cupredoxin domain
MSVSLSRRGLLQQAAGAMAAAAAGTAVADTIDKGKAGRAGRGYAAPRGKNEGDKKGADAFGYRPFTQKCPIPPVLQPKAVGQDPYRAGSAYHGIAPEYRDRRCAELPDTKWHEKFQPVFYELRAKKSVHEYMPGVKTPVYGYGSSVPGPTIRTICGQPCVIRLWNDLDLEMACHFHGLHLPSHSSGAPNHYVLPGRARDYFLPNTVPMLGGRPDYSECPSTSWYHDRALGMGGASSYYGLSGFCLNMDEMEQDLVKRNVLPAAKYDIPLCLQDRCLSSNGSLSYKAQQDEGNLGDLYVVNGKVQPVLNVERRKYRFRLLNSCNTRYLKLKLSNGMKLIRLGKDSWMYDKAVEEHCVLLCPGERADIVIDFSDCENEIYLCNSLEQIHGCRPQGKPRSGDEEGSYGDGDKDRDEKDRDEKDKYGQDSEHDGDKYGHRPPAYGGAPGKPYMRPAAAPKSGGYAPKTGDKRDEEQSDKGNYGDGCVPWLKFIVGGPKMKDCATVRHGDMLRPHRYLKPADCEKTRYFDIESVSGGYQINRRQYDGKACYDTPKCGSIERWVYRNKTADACPIHIPDGSYQICRINGQTPYRTDACKADVMTVYGGEEVEVIKHFRTFKGLYTVHCSSVEYDHRRGMHTYESK